MGTQAQNKREILKDKVVALVKDFVKTEGGITQKDLQLLFEGFSAMPGEVAATLSEMPVLFTGQP
jgi:hypothetical protein